MCHHMLSFVITCHHMLSHHHMPESRVITHCCMSCCVMSHVTMRVPMYAVMCRHFSGHSRTFYCLLTPWCVGGAEEFPNNTPCIPPSAVSTCYCRQASPPMLRADLCPVLPMRWLGRSGTAIFIPRRLSASSSHMKAQYNLKQSVVILNSFGIRVTKMCCHLTHTSATLSPLLLLAFAEPVFVSQCDTAGARGS